MIVTLHSIGVNPFSVAEVSFLQLRVREMRLDPALANFANLQALQDIAVCIAELVTCRVLQICGSGWPKRSLPSALIGHGDAASGAWN